MANIILSLLLSLVPINLGQKLCMIEKKKTLNPRTKLTYNFQKNKFTQISSPSRTIFSRNQFNGKHFYLLLQHKARNAGDRR